MCVCSLPKSFSVKLFMTLGETDKKETVYWDLGRECVTVSSLMGSWDREGVCYCVKLAES